MQGVTGKVSGATAGPNLEIERMAVIALTRDDFVSERGMCQKFVRQVIEALYQEKYQAFRGDDAKSAAALWENSEFARRPEDGSMIGDILYYASASHGPHGHVAIRISGNKVAENSTVHHNGKNGGKGTRPIQSLGWPSLIVRLPR